MQIDLSQTSQFQKRHNGISTPDAKEMLDSIGATSLDTLISETIPDNIRLKEELALPTPVSETDYLKQMKVLANKNILFKSFIGQGYYGCSVPSIIQRNILENPGWYTAYTPYQAEIAQGRLEALINFQTLVCDLTKMEIANASLLDEATAAAEGMTMLYGQRKGAKKTATKFLVDKNVFPQTIDVLITRALPLGIDIELVDLVASLPPYTKDIFGILIQYPNSNGEIVDFSTIIKRAQEADILTACATDLMAMTLLTPPGEWGVDVVVGTSQRMGVPLGFGGPHAAFLATKEQFKRTIPGRIIGVSKDVHGNDAYRMALQTREQHIKRERATSNICTAQVLLAVMSSMYAVYHGADGLKKIACKIHALTQSTANALSSLGFKNLNQLFFDTIKIPLSPEELHTIREKAEEKEINFKYYTNAVGISFDETHSLEDAQIVVNTFSELANKEVVVASLCTVTFPKNIDRKSPYLQHPVFNSYHTEHELLRYIKRLENKDLSLVHSMIPLGSCTMKLNGTTEMIPIGWAEFCNLHPFAPTSQTEGYQEMIQELSQWLNNITGFDAISFQPNSGAQGEFAGLMVIKAYLKHHGQMLRDVVLIPSSAHGTNPASAIMAGMKVVVVACDDKGNIDFSDLQEKAEKYSETLAVLMVTYPSTHGVFEASIKDVCSLIHQQGGLVYMDGANMNAQVGLTSPAVIGADVCHLNLHKTFCIPHGGGGPGMGPIGVVKKLVPFLPGHFTDTSNHQSAIAATKFSSASILPITHAYLSMMGSEGLTHATKLAILSANYIAAKLREHYPILYTNKNNRNAHEVIIDCRDFKKTGVEVEDIAKRLIDYGYHAPTVSFPVPGTMMIEPTESESKVEIDRFCNTMIAIRKEIQAIAEGTADKQNNVLKNAPHTYQAIGTDDWQHPYSRKEAAFPNKWVAQNKFWATTGRIDNAYGDRNLMCSCIPIEAYQS